MGILKDIKASWKAANAPKVMQTKVIVGGGDTTMAFISQEGSGIVTIEILSLDSFASITVANRVELPGLIATSLEMRYGTHSGYYTVEAKAGGYLTVSQDTYKVVITIFNGKDTASAKITPIEFETLLEVMRSFD